VKSVLLAFALMVSLLGVAAMAAEMTGYISDSKCGAKHMDGSAASAKCVESCIKAGATPVFVEGDKVLKIANPEKVAGHYGRKVTVTGNVDGDTLTVDSIKAARAKKAG
jgi:hypothetical protein